ncbi:MAG: hypothetical protein EA352_09465 [Gemmatimonadales bacterium]|nr:MAG: hypothetical protein EA352_09465 [Gemmatimonadales bacterium]
MSTSPPPSAPDGSDTSELERRARELEARLQSLEEALLEAESAPLPLDFRSRAAARTALIHLREAMVAARRALERLDTAAGARQDAPRVFGDQQVEDARTSGVGSLPPGLSRFVRDRVRSPGFRWEVEHDLERGWILHWKDWGVDDRLLGGGRIVENPWVERSD